MAWHGETLVGFDLETTGTEPLEARIVTASIIEVDGGGHVTRRRDWLADPGILIPEQASAIHGISTERAAAEGRPVREVADEIAQALAEYWEDGVPVVAYNASFDLTLLSAELRRHGLPSLSERLGGVPIGPVVDPYTIDRAVDRYRRGKRNLEAVCGTSAGPPSTGTTSSAACCSRRRGTDRPSRRARRRSPSAARCWSPPRSAICSTPPTAPSSRSASPTRSPERSGRTDSSAPPTCGTSPTSASSPPTTSTGAGCATAGRCPRNR
ncbi:exonuclease domain-containing protein [Streptomyces massasporeus]